MGDADTALRLLGLARAVFAVVSESSRVLYAGAASVLAIPGIDTDPRFSFALACAAMHSANQGDDERASRYCDDAVATEQRLGVPESPEVWGARMWIAVTQARVDDYLAASEHMAALCHASGDDLRLSLSLSQSALARALRSTELDIAIADVNEALVLARRIGAPTLLVSVLGFAAFVLADAEPDQARACMEEAVSIKELRRVRGPVHAVLGDVAERLGERRLALEYFANGMEEQNMLGLSEQIGRMFQRIGLLLVGDDPETAAVLTGAAAKRSIGYTMTQRVVNTWKQGMADLDSTLGEAARHALQARGVAMDDHEAMAVARTAVARALEGVH